MNAGDWIALILGAPTLAGGGMVTVLKVTSKLTRIAVAVEQGTEAVKAIAVKVDDHEKRLTKGGL